MIYVSRPRRGQQRTLEELQSIPAVAKPSFGRRWWGIPHADLAAAVLAATRKQDVGCQFAFGVVNPSEENVSLLFDIPRQQVVPGVAGWRMQIGVMNSNTRNYRLRVFCGGWNVKEKYGFVLKELTEDRYATRRSQSFSLSSKLEDCVWRSLLEFVDFDKQMEEMRRRELLQKELDKIFSFSLYASVRKRILTWTRVGQVARSFSERKKQDGCNCWTLYQCAARVVKKIPPQWQMDKLDAFRKLLPAQGERLRLE